MKWLSWSTIIRYISRYPCELIYVSFSFVLNLQFVYDIYIRAYARSHRYILSPTSSYLALTRFFSVLRLRLPYCCVFLFSNRFSIRARTSEEEYLKVAANTALPGCGSRSTPNRSANSSFVLLSARFSFIFLRLFFSN